MKRNLMYFIIWNSIIILGSHFLGNILAIFNKELQMTYDYKYITFGYWLSIGAYIILGIMITSLSKQLKTMKLTIQIIFAFSFIYFSLSGVSALFGAPEIYEKIYPTWIANSRNMLTGIGSIALGMITFQNFFNFINKNTNVSNSSTIEE
ncbi:MAG: hypothetical protein CVV02_02125 [Firmicutes bacterium HGW-Firmicutes-7]|nr:MAG: hypothetical protein CVV02_02125 [Firmicutes bacterium HGW-Firmicutes-7]